MPARQTAVSCPRKTSLVRRAIAKQSSGRAYHGQARARSVIAKQSSGCAYHGQACAQCYNAAVEQVRVPLSGVRAALERSTRAGALTIVKRARVQQSGGRAYHGQA